MDDEARLQRINQSKEMNFEQNIESDEAEATEKSGEQNGVETQE
jgi:hypothetical protein